MEIAHEPLNEVNDDAETLKSIIAGDETWDTNVTWKLKAQSSEWKHRGLRRPKKARQVRSSVKVILPTILTPFT